MANSTQTNGGAVLAGLAGVAVLGTGIYLYASSRANTVILNGTVISAADGKAIVRAQVAIAKQTATTGSTGKFTIKSLPKGDNAITITAAGFDTYTATLSLIAGNNNKTFAMTKTGTALAALTGTVTSIDTGTPILGANISIAGKSATTAADGTYTITGLPTGIQTGTCSLSGYNTVTKSITLAVGQNTLNFQITNRGTVTGTVVDSVTGAPVAGAVVAGPSGSGLSATSNANGLYSIVVPSSVTALGCAADGYQTQSQPVTIQPGASIPLNFSMVKTFTQTGTIQGAVTNANDGTPIAGATVVFQPGSYSTRSGANGFYSIDLPTGAAATNYSITANASGFNQWTGSVLLSVGAIATKNIPMTPTAVPPGEVAGVVLDAVSNSYLQGVQINILRLDGSQTGLTATTDATGYYSIASVPAGSYTIWAAKSGYGQQSQNLTITSGQETFVSFSLQPAATAIGFTMDLMVDPSNYPEAYYWYADLNFLIFNYFALINNYWNEQTIDMSRSDFAQQTLTVQLYDANYNPIYDPISGALAKAVVNLGGRAGPLIQNNHVYSFNFDQQVLYDDGLRSG